ncbi:energy transducer TonB [Hymenobacter sp. DG01]|uniref:energy transducer TonB n=1 Tax=Hymenobacter sp. DG01 TaxID=2584940 RepID=UPI00111F5511|nr:energy transducer TonB [Hymenobacter sp. DG01]
MRKHLLLLSLGLSSIATQAQEYTGSSTTTTAKYFNKQGDIQPTAEGASYSEETELKEGNAATVRTFYISGKPRSVIFYEDLARHMVHGISEGWHENGNLSWHSEMQHGKPSGPYRNHYPSGQLHYEQNYADGKRQGELVVYYPDGRLKRREIYADNQRVNGTCYNPQGQEMPCYEFEVMPSFPGGQQALLQYIGQNTRYPGKALRRGVEGKVFVKFVVDTTGVVSNVRIDKGVDPLLDTEAVHVVKNLPRFEPGRQDGRPVPVYFTVPITFSINKSSLFRQKPRAGNQPASGL